MWEKLPPSRHSTKRPERIVGLPKHSQRVSVSSSVNAPLGCFPNYVGDFGGFIEEDKKALALVVEASKGLRVLD